MQLTPEERRRIYEEEKARIEAESQQRRESSSSNLEPNVASFLCYLGAWITGIIFLIIEQKNKLVRFHAVQSILIFVPLSVLSAILGTIPYAGKFFNAGLGIITFVLWVVLMVKTYRGEFFHIPVIGELAENIVGLKKGEAEAAAAAVPPLHQPAEPYSPVGQTTARKPDKWRRKRAGRILASSVGIAWSLVLLIFLNFFYQYIAYYNGSTENGVSVWVRYPILSSNYSLWLPVLNIALGLAIVGYAVTVVYDSKTLPETILLIQDVFGVIVVTSLLAIYPFDFNSLPYHELAVAFDLGIRLALGVIALGLGIGILVRLIRLVFGLAKPENY